MREYGFPMTHILLHKDRIYDCILGICVSVKTRILTYFMQCDAYCNNYWWMISIMSDFNIDIEKASWFTFVVQTVGVKINKDSTSYRNIDNYSYIDVLLTNSAKSFENICTIETGLSHFINCYHSTRWEARTDASGGYLVHEF